MGDIIKIHIWELPEKITKIDPSSEYTIIHDGIILKKVTLEKIYSYFSQDYKIQNLASLFDTLIQTENKRYNTLYTSLEYIMSEFEKEIEELEDKFNINRNDIRKLTTMSGQLDNNNKFIFSSFTNNRNKLSELSNKFSEHKNDMEQHESRHDEIRNTIIKLNDITHNLNNTKIDIINNNKYIFETIYTTQSNVSTKTDTQSVLLTNTINTEYDKVLAILDHYHHIFNEDTHK